MIQESLSTLRYADRAKKIKNKAVVNEDPNQKLIRELREEVEKLRAQLSGAVVPADVNMNELLEKEREEIKQQLEQQKAEELKRYREQLEEAERLLKESSMSWEEKLKLTEEMAQQRTQELSSMGVVDDAVRIEKAKDTPNLVNLNEDPFMAECLIYFLKSGETRIGREDAEQKQDITLKGLSLLKEHCVITNTGEDQDLVLHPFPNAKIFVNGVQVAESTALHHSYRLVLGNNHIFRVNHPIEKRKEREGKSEDEEIGEVVDWEYAIKEMAATQLNALSAEEKEMREKEAKEMEQKMAELEKKMEEERQKALEDAERKREEYEKKERELMEELKAREESLKSEMSQMDDEEIKKKMQVWMPNFNHDLHFFFFLELHLFFFLLSLDVLLIIT